MIPESSLLLRIPFTECLIGADESELFQLFLQLGYASTKWSEYIAFVLSTGCLEDVPIMWTKEQQRDRIACVPSLAALAEALHSDEGQSTVAPAWVKAYVMSRSFELENGSIAVVPFGDMFNHSSGGFNTRLRELDDCFVFYAEKDIPQGDQIFNHYGESWDAMSMYVTHGFFDSDMIRNTVYAHIGDMLIRIDENGRNDLPEEILVDLAKEALAVLSSVEDRPCRLISLPEELHILFHADKRMWSKVLARN